MAALGARAAGIEGIQAALDRLQEQLNAQQRLKTGTADMHVRSAELHAHLDSALLGKARAERERDSHALLAESLQQALERGGPIRGAGIARPAKEHRHSRHCRTCRRTLPG